MVVKMLPHHGEGVQRLLSWGKEHEGHRIMYQLLLDALAEDPEAEMIFIQGYDDFCQSSCIERGKEPPCKRIYGTETTTQDMDKEVADAHGWELNKPYKIRNLLEELKREGTDRTMFYIHPLPPKLLDKWREDMKKVQQIRENTANEANHVLSE